MILAMLILSLVVCTSCTPLSAEETEQEKAYYEEKYADEPEPSPLVQKVLAFLDTCVGGQYVFGGQGDLVTQTYIENIYDHYPEYFSDGRFEYLMGIAEECAQEGCDYPEDYVWDCSGLWWYCCNALMLYHEWTDRTANDTYTQFCTPIEKDELRPGDLVFVENSEGHITHMGIVGEKGYIYEAVSGFVGVVKKRTVDKRIYNDIVRGGVLVFKNWNVFGRPKIFESE